MVGYVPGLSDLPPKMATCPEVRGTLILDSLIVKETLLLPKGIAVFRAFHPRLQNTLGSKRQRGEEISQFPSPICRRKRGCGIGQTDCNLAIRASVF